MHVAILKAYTSGLELSDSDAMLLVDVVPNRRVLNDLKKTWNFETSFCPILKP